MNDGKVNAYMRIGDKGKKQRQRLGKCLLGIVYYSNSVTVYNTCEEHHSGNQANRDVEDSQHSRQNPQSWLFANRDNDHGFKNVRSRAGFNCNQISI